MFAPHDLLFLAIRLLYFCCKLFSKERLSHQISSKGNLGNFFQHSLVFVSAHCPKAFLSVLKSLKVIQKNCGTIRHQRKWKAFLDQFLAYTQHVKLCLPLLTLELFDNTFPLFFGQEFRKVLKSKYLRLTIEI